MTPSQPEHVPLTVPDDEMEIVGSTDCNPEPASNDPFIVISSDEEDNNNTAYNDTGRNPTSRNSRGTGRSRTPEVIDISDTERPDEPEEEEDPRLNMERIFLNGFQQEQHEYLNNGFGFFRQPHYPVRAERNTGESSFSPRQFAQYHQFISRIQGIPGLGFGPHMRDDPAFEADLQRAMRASMEDSLSNFGPKKVAHPEPPSTTTPGYTRSVRKRQVVCCALCRSDLGVGVPSEPPKSSKTSPKKRKRFSRFSDLTDVERTLSKRMFFTKCGHVYCGLCVQNIRRRRTSRQKKEDKTNINVDCITDFKGRYVDTPFSLIDHCVVPGCKEKLPRSRGKFFKEMFT